MDVWLIVVLAVLGVIFGLLLIIILLQLLLCCVCRRSHRNCTSEADLTGKTVLITGANAGIGYYTALDLARRNASVALACRNRERGLEAVNKIKVETRNENIRLYSLDTSSLASVRQCAEEFKMNESRLDILINNAGINASTSQKQEKTSEGFELVMATNHFGHFLLTNLLLDMMKASAPSRIVNVASDAHLYGRIDFENLHGETRENKKVYLDSKLANVLFTRELARRLEGTGVIANSLHPGVVLTQFFVNVPSFFRQYANKIGRYYFKSPEEGAQTSIHCAVSEDLEGVTGRYFKECAITQESARARDDEVARRLWDVSAECTGLSASGL